MATEDRYEALRHDLKARYRQNTPQLCPIPWQVVTTDPSQVCTYKNMFTKLMLQEPGWQNELQGNLNNTRKPIISMNKVLRTKSVTGSHSRSIFISGAAGSGKSTLCEKLVYDWSRDIDDVTNLMSYELVFLIKVANLQKEDESITSYIHRVLLVEESRLYVSDILSVMRRPELQEKILFILDGYDELSADGEDLSKLIHREIYPNTTILLTTRQSAKSALRISGSFECQFHLIGFNETNSHSFISKYRAVLEEDNLPPLNTRDHPLSAMLHNPLHLWFIAIFKEETFRTCMNSTFSMTSFMREAIQEWMKRAEIPLNKPLREGQGALNKLSKIAYRSLCQDEMHFTTSLTKYELSLGFASRTKSAHAQNAAIYVFNHKLLQEYLAALYITKKKSDICEQLQALPELMDESRCEATSVLKFVCGQLRGKDDVLLKVFTMFVDKLRYHGTPLPLECICESGLFKGVKSMIRNFTTPNVFLTTNESFYYYKALSLLVSDSKLSGYNLNHLSINGALVMDKHACAILLKHARFISLSSQQYFNYYLGVDGVCRRFAIDKLALNCFAGFTQVGSLTVKSLTDSWSPISVLSQVVNTCCKQLEELTLLGTGESDPTEQYDFKETTSLRKLHIYVAHNVDQLLHAVCETQSMNTLQQLLIDGCGSADAIITFIEQLPALKSVKLDDITLRSQHIGMLIQRGYQLECLELSGDFGEVLLNELLLTDQDTRDRVEWQTLNVYKCKIENAQEWKAQVQELLPTLTVLNIREGSR